LALTNPYVGGEETSMSGTTGRKRGGIYCRISLKKKTEDTKNPIPKVEAQEDMCRTLAEAHEIEVVKVYTDDGISASTFKDRPGWADLLADVEAGRLDVVLAQAEDRFTRQPMEKETLMLACTASGVTFLTVNDGHTDPATADGEFFATLRAALGRMESRKMGKRKRDTNEGRRARGVIPLNGPRPFGWQEDRLRLDEAEAALIKQAYKDLIAGDRTPSAIATAWNKAGVLTSRGGRWNIPSVQAVLKRPRNAGIMTYYGKPVPSEDGEPIKPTWEPIVDEDTYRAALAILENPARRRTKQHVPKYLTASLAQCGACGAPMRSAKNRGHAVYRCATHDAYGPKLTEVRHAHIRAEDLDRIVTNAVVSAVMHSGTDALPEADTQALNGLHARLSAIRQAEANLVKLVRSEAFNEAEVAGEKRALKAEAEEVEHEIATIAHRNARAALLVDVQANLWSPHRVDIREQAELRAEIRERFEGLSLDQRRALVKGLLEVTVGRGRGAKRVEIRHLVATQLNDTEEDVA